MPTSDKVQILIELLKQGDGARAAAADLKAVEATAERTSNAAATLKRALTGLFAGLSAKFILSEIGQATLSLERMTNTLNAVSGAAAGREFGFVREQADRLGLELESTTGAYAKLNAAAKGTRLEGEGVREIFLGVVEAGTALQLSSNQMEGALTAIQQIMSKGTVQAEELRGQLGERLPGAFNIAARAMGVTTQELGKMLEQGQLLASDFLPRFAEELRRSFGPEAEANSKSLNAELNRLRTSLFELKAAIGGDANGIFRDFVTGTRAAVQAMRENREVLESVAVTLGLVSASYAAGRGSIAAYTAAQAALGATAGTTTISLTALQAALNAPVSPALSLAAAIGGIATAVYTLTEFLKALQAQFEESKSRDNLIAQLEAQRKAVEKQIELYQQLGKITEEQANRARAAIAEAFKKEIVVTIPNPVATIGPGASVTAREPDLKAREDALSQVRRGLAPELFQAQKTPEPDFTSKTSRKEPSYDDTIKSVEQLRALQERMFIESLSGLDKEEARIQANYEARERQIDQLNRKLNLGTEELAQLKDLNLSAAETERAEVQLRQEQKAKAEERRREQELAKQANDELQRLEQSLTTQAINSSETRIQQAQREFNARLQLIDQLFAAGKIDGDRWNELSVQANNQRLQSIALAVQQGRLEEQTLGAITEGKDLEVIAVRKSFDERRANLEAYYALEIEKAQGNALAIEAIETRKAETLRQLSFQQELATSRIAQGLLDVGRAAETQFASGMARAFISIAEGSKSASEAFKDFASSFLRLIAEMILQTLILIAVRTALKAIPGVGAFLGGGGQASAPATAAAGGVFDEHIRRPAAMAAAGIALRAAGGVDGVSEVDRATYFPKFNVIAGEAGREVLTVMAKPELVEINGKKAIFGSVQGKRIAMMSAEELLRLPSDLRPKAAAEGFVSALGPAIPKGSSGSASVTQREGPNGQIEVVVSLSPELKAEVIRASVEGAVARVTQELGQDGKLSAAAKRLTR